MTNVYLCLYSVGTPFRVKYYRCKTVKAINFGQAEDKILMHMFKLKQKLKVDRIFNLVQITKTGNKT